MTFEEFENETRMRAEKDLNILKTVVTDQANENEFIFNDKLIYKTLGTMHLQLAMQNELIIDLLKRIHHDS